MLTTLSSEGAVVLALADILHYLFASAVAHLLHWGPETRGLADARRPREAEGDLGQLRCLWRRGYK